jgi:hypothetical protein
MTFWELYRIIGTNLELPDNFGLPYPISKKSMKLLAGYKVNVCSCVSQALLWISMNRHHNWLSNSVNVTHRLLRKTVR